MNEQQINKANLHYIDGNCVIYTLATQIVLNLYYAAIKVFIIEMMSLISCAELLIVSIASKENHFVRNLCLIINDIFEMLDRIEQSNEWKEAYERTMPGPK